MGQTVQPNSTVGRLFTVAMGVTVLALFAALYVKFTVRPAPHWIEYVYVATWAMIGLQHLLFPNPRWTPLSRYGLAAVFFALSILFLVFTILE